jgi:hypothetical protein
MKLEQLNKGIQLKSEMDDAQRYLKQIKAWLNNNHNEERFHNEITLGLDDDNDDEYQVNIQCEDPKLLRTLVQATHDFYEKRVKALTLAFEEL